MIKGNPVVAFVLTMSPCSELQSEKLASRNQFILAFVEDADGDWGDVTFAGGRAFFVFEIDETVLRFGNVLDKDGSFCF